jgi:hypothetical protein
MSERSASGLRITQDKRRQFEAKVTVPANSVSEPIVFGFEADNITVFPDEPLSATAYLYRDRVSGAGRPIKGSGMVQTNWEAQRIYIKNTSLVPADFFVFASYGYPPDVWSLPVTEAAPLTTDILSSTRYELLYTSMPSPQTFNHNHVGKYVLVGIATADTNYTLGGSHVPITAVTIAGITAINKVSFSSNPPNGDIDQHVSWWWAEVPEGIAQISMTFQAGGWADILYAWAFSFSSLVTTGVVDGASLVSAGPNTMTLHPTKDASLTLAMFINNVYAPSEISGASIWDTFHALATPDRTTYVGAHYREGKAPAVFSYTQGAALRKTYAGIEVRPQ